MRIFFIIALMSCCLVTYAQTSAYVKGIIKDKSTSEAIEFASVSLNDAVSKKIIAGTVTDENGKFKFSNIPSGDYYLVAGFIGYETQQTSLYSLNESYDVGIIYLTESSQMLDEVVVEGRKSAFVAKLDRKVYNVGSDLFSKAGAASDLLQNIPSVEVDMDGNVSLRGNENVTILINGKPSAMMNSKTRGDALNQLSANSIERIEVVSNPSAEFKPDGMSGIINIVLKKDAKAGFGGSATANVGSYGRYNAGVNLNMGLHNVNLFGGYSFRRDRYDRSIVDWRESPTEHITQNTYGLGRPVSHTFRLGMNWNITAKDLMEISGAYNRRNFQRNELVESGTYNLSGVLLSSYHRDRDAFAKENMWEANFRYAHTFNDRSDLSLEYSYSSESEDEINRYNTIDKEGESKENEGVWDANYLNLARLRWQQTFSDNMKLISGYEFEHLRAEQNFHVSDLIGEAFEPNPDRSSDFTHYMTLNTLYSTIELGFGKWMVLPGVRLEYADIENRLISHCKSIRQHYFNIYPTIHISRQMTPATEILFNYSLRVNRPEGTDMNPFAERINPLSLQAGNPYLKPEKIHSLEAGWLLRTDNGMSLMTTLYYRYITNKITDVSKYVDSGVLLTTKENMDASQNAGAEIIWSWQPWRWLSFNCNLNGYYNKIVATKLGFGKNKDAFAWSALMNANFIPFRHCTVQLNARFRSATLVPQGRRNADCRINLGLMYDIPSINLSVIASVTDLFDTYKKSFTLDTPELKQKVDRRRNPRIFYVGVSWQFAASKGKQHQNKIEYDEGM